MSLLTYYTKGIISNKRLWTVGVAQMVMWLFLFSYVFTGNPKNVNAKAMLSEVGTLYGYLSLAILAVLSGAMATSISYASYSLAYSFRYTKLSPKSYLWNLIGSSTILGAILSVLMLVLTYAIFSSRFDMNLSPANPLDAVGVSAIAGVFELAFGALLVLLVVNYLGMQSQGLLNFVPIMLSVALGLSQAFATLPKLIVYISPFNEIESLLYEGYSGHAPHLLLSDPSTPLLDPQLLLLGLGAWIVAILVIDGVLLSRLRPRQIVEGRQI
jgi:hypothetical protein